MNSVSPTPRARKRKAPARKSPPKAPGFTDPHVLKAIAYADDVLAGKIIAGRLTLSACQRFRRDLGRIGDASWPFRLDEAKAGRACRFIELMPHIKGPKANAGERLKLEGWQCFLIAQFFGWVKKADGFRRFKRASVWVARGNGKTAIGAPVMLYAGFADGEAGAECYSAATVREQSRLSFDVAAAMLQKNEPLRTKLGIEVGRHAIIQARSNSTYRALSQDAGKTGDGLNVAACLLDELHAHPNRELHDVMETATGKRKQSFLWIISTAGNDSSGIGFEQYTYARKILEGGIEDESVLAAIWEADDDDLSNWDDPRVWAKANPNLGVSVELEVLEQLAVKARQLASARAAFFTRHLNKWVGAHSAFLNLAHWDRCVDPAFNRAEFDGEPVWLGLDLASRKDLSCLAFVWRREVDGRPHYWIAVDSYLPEEAVSDGANASYRGWQLEGWIKTNEGNEIDYQRMESEILSARERYDVRECSFDNYQPAAVVAQNLTNEGMAMVEVRTTYLHMNPPMRELEAALASGRVHIEPNPCLRWMASNVIGKERGDEVRPEKETPGAKIDGIVAVLMALNRAMADQTAYQAGEGFREL